MASLIGKVARLATPKYVYERGGRSKPIDEKHVIYFEGSTVLSFGSAFRWPRRFIGSSGKHVKLMTPPVDVKHKAGLDSGGTLRDSSRPPVRRLSETAARLGAQPRPKF